MMKNNKGPIRGFWNAIKALDEEDGLLPAAEPKQKETHNSSETTTSNATPTVELSNEKPPISKPIDDAYFPRSPFLIPSNVRIKRADEFATDGVNDGSPARLLGRFVHQGEVTLLAAPSNVGKSIFAVAFAHALANANPKTKTGFLGFPFEKPSKVLYYDFELSVRQFGHRYYGLLNSPNFIRAEYDFTADYGSAFSTQAIAEHVRQTEADVIIIDNLSALIADFTDINQFSSAKRLIWDLKRLVAAPMETTGRPSLTVLLLAHTRKLNGETQLMDEMINGSRNLVNLSDSVLMMGQLKENFRYIKQTKARSAPLYSQCLLCQIEDRAGFLTLDAKGWHDEDVLLGKTDTLPDVMTAPKFDTTFLETEPHDENARYRLASYAQHLRERGQSLRQIARLYKEKGYADLSYSSIRRLLLEAYGPEVFAK